MTYSSHINAQDALGYSRLGINFGMTQELFITGCVGLTKQRHKTNEILETFNTFALCNAW